MSYRSMPLDKGLRKTRNGIFAMALFVLTATSIYYFNDDGIYEKDLTTVKQLIITEPVRKDHTTGKGRHDWYVFKFRGHNNEFRFDEYYYNYADKSIATFDFNEWDTVSIQLRNRDLKYFNNPYSTTEIEIVNVAKDKGFYIGHTYRNAQLQKRNKGYFIFGITFFTVSVLAGLSINLHHYLLWRKT